MSGGVELSTMADKPNRISNNLGVGVQSTSNGDDDDPWGVKVIGPLEVSGNASWGVLTIGRALLGGQSAES
jgi:hypothetical protein